MELSKAVAQLNEYCRPNLAENWDNVGLIVEPSVPHQVKRILVTNDVSENVLNEAIKMGANLILSYHPPIFTPLKHLTQSHWKERIIVKCIENRVAVYSPHTGLDSKEGGLNDWLLSPFRLKTKVSITPPAFVNEDIFEVTALCNDAYRAFSLALPLAPMNVDVRAPEGRVARFKYPKCQKEKIEEIAKAHGVNFLTKEVIHRVHPTGQGTGRVGMLEQPMCLEDIIASFQKLLGQKHLKVSLGDNKSLRDKASCLAVCAGSGGGVLTRQPPAQLADFLVTGEATHHELLEATSRGATILILGHQAVEKNYLNNVLVPWMKQNLSHVDSNMAACSLNVPDIV